MSKLQEEKIIIITITHKYIFPGNPAAGKAVTKKKKKTEMKLTGYYYTDENERLTPIK